MAEHYTQGHVDAFGRRMSDEEWDMNARMREASRQETVRRQAEPAANIPAPMGWGEFGAGLAGSGVRGATLGFSDYFNDGLKEAATKFENQYPVTAGIANILGALGGTVTGTAEEGLAARGLQLAGRGIEAISPRLARVGGAVLSHLAPSGIPYLGKIAPDAIKSAAQGATYAYNTSSNNDPDPLGNAGESAVLGAVLGPVAGLVGSRVNRVVNAAGANANVNKAVRKTLEATGLDGLALKNKLSQLSGNARTYNADPTALGAGGILGNIARAYPQFRPEIRNTARENIAKIGEASQGLAQQELGFRALPGTYDDYLAAADEARRQAVAPLYEAADKIPVDLTAHPDLLHHYVIGDEFAHFLNKARNSATVDPAARDEANRFLANRAQAVSAAENSVRGLDSRQVGRDTYNRIYNDTLTSHVADNNLDLSVPRPLISNYIDDLNANRPDYTKQITRLTANPVNDATRVADMTSRAIQEISPEYAAAQQMYANMSTPQNQAALAQTFTKRGSAEKLDSQVTKDFIDRNRDYAQRATDAGLADDSGPLTGYVLNEKILNASNGDPALTPSAILKTINPNVRPRLEDVFGQDKVSNLLNKAQRNDQLISDNMGLSRIGHPDTGGTGRMIHTDPTGYALHKAVEISKKAVNTKEAQALMDFLQSNPEIAIKHISDYLKKFPNGTQEGYLKYLSAVAGNIAGQVPPTDIDTDDYRR